MGWYIGEVTENWRMSGAHLCHSSFSNPSVTSPTSQFILQPFFRLCYVTGSSLTSPGRAHSPTLPSLYLCHSSFSNPSVASPTSQFILQPFFRFSYVTGSSLTPPGEPPVLSYNEFISFQAQFLDVIGFNRYNSWYSDPGHTEVIGVTVREEVAAWREKHNKPIFMTEYGADTMAGLHLVSAVYFISLLQIPAAFYFRATL